MKPTACEDRLEDGYIFIAFLFLVALLAATVSMFALMALNNQRSATASHDQETSYQMARAGLSVWMGKVREDYENNHFTDDPDNMCNYKYCEEMTDGKAAAGLGPSRRSQNCPCGGGGGGGADPRETLEHPWGWGNPITDKADEDGDTLLLGEKVYFPSGELSAQRGDSGYFRIKKVIDASGELEETPDNVETDCKDSGGSSGGLNVNTASSKFLQQVVYDTEGHTLTKPMAEAIIKERSGSDQSVSDPDGDGIELEEEVYTDGLPDPFDSKEDACEYLADNFGDIEKEHCEFPSVLGDNIAVESHQGKFCADIRGAAIKNTGGSSDDPEVTSRYDLRAKVERPIADESEDTFAIRVLTIEQQ